MNVDINNCSESPEDTENESTIHKVISKEMCRLCGKEVSNYVPIFSENQYIVEKISRCLPIMVHSMDKLPSHICKRCLHYLNISYKLIINAIKVDTLLREKLRSSIEQCPDDINMQPRKSASLIPRTEANISIKNLRKTAENGPMICELCSTLFLDMNAFDRHMETIHMLVEHCDLCDTNFLKPNKLLVQKESKHAKHIVNKTSHVKTDTNVRSAQEESIVTEVTDPVVATQTVNIVPVVQNQAEKLKVSCMKTIPNIIRTRNTTATSKLVQSINKKPIKLIPINPLNFTSQFTSKIIPASSSFHSSHLKIVPLSKGILPTSTLKILPNATFPASNANTAIKICNTNSSISTSNKTLNTLQNISPMYTFSGNSQNISANPTTPSPTVQVLPSNSIISIPTTNFLPANISVVAPTANLQTLPTSVSTSNLIPLGPNLPVVPANAKIMIPRIANKVSKLQPEKSNAFKEIFEHIQDSNTAQGDDDSDDSLSLPLQPAPTTTNMSNCSLCVKCDICGVYVDDDDFLVAHKKVHTPKTMRCKICQTECESFYHLYVHKRAAHNLYKRVALKFSCEQCGKFFTNSWQWENHEEHKCKQKFPAYPCKYCNMGFSTNHKFKRHLRKHKKEMLNDPDVQVYKCVACPKVFVDEEFYQKHRNVHDPECWDKFKCRVCNRSFRDNVRLKEHQQSIHDGIKPHQCDVCGRTFHRRSNMKAHREKHFGYNCENCEENFEKMNMLITHIKEVHKIEPSPRLLAKKQYKSGCFVCRFCGKKLSTYQSVLDHERIHTGEKPHGCQICGKTFRSYTARWAHVQRHQKGNFTCEHCGKTFSYKQNLMTHMLTHMPVEERKHQCDKCGKKFLRKGHLNIHMRIHNGERPYTCDICLFSFTQMGDMKRHRARHSDDHTKTRKGRIKMVSDLCNDIDAEINFIVNESDIIQEEPIQEVEIS